MTSPGRRGREQAEVENGPANAMPAPLAADFRPPSGPINVLLYVTDTERLDRLSAYGYSQPTSPELEALAQRSAVFRTAYSSGPSTTPSMRTSMRTSMRETLQ